MGNKELSITFPSLDLLLNRNSLWLNFGMDGGFICWKSGDQINWKFLSGPPFPLLFFWGQRDLGKRWKRKGGKRGKRKILIRSGMRPWDVIQRKLQNPQRVVKLNKLISEEYFFRRNCPGFRPYDFKSGITITSVLVFWIFFLWKQVRMESQQWMKRRRDPLLLSPMSRKPRFPLTCEKGENHPPFFSGKTGVGWSDGRSEAFVSVIAGIVCGKEVFLREKWGEGWKKRGRVNKNRGFSVSGG